MTCRRRVGSCQLNKEHPMSRKPSKQSRKEPSPQETKSKAPKKTGPGEISAAENLANELANVPITEVAKIAAILSRKSFSEAESVGKAYKLLEACALGRNGIKKGSGHQSELGGNRNLLFTRSPSNLRWQNLKAAFPEIITPHDEPPYHVPFEEGLAKLMGKNTTIAERPKILSRFLEQERQNFKNNHTLSPLEASGWIEMFKSHGIPAPIYTDLWFFFPLWRATDISAQKAKNAQKIRRRARPPKTNDVQTANLDALKYAAYDKENS